VHAAGRRRRGGLLLRCKLLQQGLLFIAVQARYDHLVFGAVLLWRSRACMRVRHCIVTRNGDSMGTVCRRGA